MTGHQEEQTGNPHAGADAAIHSCDVFLMDTTVFFLEAFQLRPTNIIKGDLLYLNSTNCRYEPHLQNTFTATPVLVFN